MLIKIFDDTSLEVKVAVSDTIRDALNCAVYSAKET